MVLVLPTEFNRMQGKRLVDLPLRNKICSTKTDSKTNQGTNDSFTNGTKKSKFLGTFAVHPPTHPFLQTLLLDDTEEGVS